MRKNEPVFPKQLTKEWTPTMYFMEIILDNLKWMGTVMGPVIWRVV